MVKTARQSDEPWADDMFWTDDRGWLTEETDMKTIAKVTIQVAGPPQIVARDDEAETAFETSVDIDVLANDEGPPGRLIVTRIVTPPPADVGSAVIASDRQSVLFTPAGGFVGEASFEYQTGVG